HPWTSASNQTHAFHLVERLPHTDQTRAASGWIKNHVRQFPCKLLSELIAHGLFAFDPIRLLERGHIEPSLGLLALGYYPAAIGYQSVNERNGSASLTALDHVCRWSVFWHENVGFKTGSPGICRKCASCIAGGGHCQLSGSQFTGHGHSDGHPPG